MAHHIESNGAGVCSACVLKALRRLTQKLSTLEYKTFWAIPFPKRCFLPFMKNQSCTQMRWCFLITCTGQFPRDQMCRYMPSQEKRKVKEFYSDLSGMTSLRRSKELSLSQSLPCYVPSCVHLKRGFLFVLSLLLLPKSDFLALSAPLLSLMPCSWQLLEAAAACLCLLLTDGSVSSGQAAPASCLCGSAQLYFGIQHPAAKIYSVFPKNNKEKEESVTLWAVAVPAFSAQKKPHKVSVFRAAEGPGHLNKIPYQRWLQHMSAFTPFTLSCW